MKSLMLLAQFIITVLIFTAALTWLICHIINGSMPALGLVITAAITALIGLLACSSYNDLSQRNK